MFWMLFIYAVSLPGLKCSFHSHMGRMNGTVFDNEMLSGMDLSREYVSVPVALQDCKGSRESQQMIYHKRLQNLRKEMSTNDVTTYILLGVDLYQELDKNQRKNVISYLTGYRGNFAALVVSEDTSSIYLDETYSIYSATPLTNLSCSWKVAWIENRRNHLDQPHKTIIFAAPFRQVLEQHLTSYNLTAAKKIGFYHRQMPIHAYKEWMKIINYKVGEINMELNPETLLIALKEELIAKVWDNDEDNPRPPAYKTLTYYIPERYNGMGWRQKVQELREKLTDHRANAILVSEYDETSYLLNMRNNAFRYTSVIEGNVVVDYFRIWIFNASSFEDKALDELDKHDVGVVFTDINDEPLVRKRLNMVSDQGRILATDDISYFYNDCLNNSNVKLLPYSPVRDMMMIKTQTERRGMRNSALRHAYAYLLFMAEVEKKVENKTDLTEYQALIRLVFLIRQDPFHRGLCEPSVSAFGSNTAIVAYRAMDLSTSQKSKSISTMGLYIADTSNHYLDGTTTIGRTFHFGSPLKKEQTIYTRLLQGLIQIAVLNFPPSITDNDLEAILLAPLHSMGLTTSLTVGHGIGVFTTLRELPIRIRRKTATEIFVELRPGMMISLDPQYYHGVEFGIKLRSIFEVVLSNLSHSSKTVMYTFIPVTYFPFEDNLIVEKLLSVKEPTVNLEETEVGRLSFEATGKLIYKRWLNAYNAMVKQKLGNYARIQINREAVDFLMKRVKKNYSIENPECVPHKGTSTPQVSNRAARTQRPVALTLGILCFVFFVKYVLFIVYANEMFSQTTNES